MSSFIKPCDCSDQLQGVPGPPRPKMPKKSQKGRSGPVPKKRRKSKKSRKSAKERLFRDFFDFFGNFLARRADRPRTTFLRRFLAFLGPEGLALPVTGRYNRKSSLFCTRPFWRMPKTTTTTSYIYIYILYICRTPQLVGNFRL